MKNTRTYYGTEFNIAEKVSFTSLVKVPMVDLFNLQGLVFYFEGMYYKAQGSVF